MEELQRKAYELEIELLKSKVNILELEKQILINQFNEGKVVYYDPYQPPAWNGYPYTITCSAN